MAKLENAARAFTVTSGMGALDVICRLLKPEDEVVAGDDLYGGTNRLLTYLNTHNNIKVHHVDTSNADVVAPVLNHKTRLILLESPSNPMMKIAGRFVRY